MKKLFKILRISNYTVSFVIILLGLFVILSPLAPEASYVLAKASGENSLREYVNPANKLNIEELIKEKSEKEKIDSPNKLIIPDIFVDGEIHEGGKEALENGLWRRPGSANPAKGGNTVIVAHRFLYENGPNTFYHLDKLKEGDRFTIIWENKVYIYEIFDIFMVEPEDIYVEFDTVLPMVTLYTCAPLYSADKRLVVRASLV